MNESLIGIPIPIELSSNVDCKLIDYGIKNKPMLRVIRNSGGLYDCVEFYSLDKTINKKIYYKSGNITKIEKFNNGKLVLCKDFCEENGKLECIKSYNKDEDEVYKILLRYSRDNRIIGITKVFNNESYSIEYKYDQLYRVNSRRIIVNNQIIDEEHFKFDIFERITEYSNRNFDLLVLDYTKDFKLAKYKIVDKNFEELLIQNNFTPEGEYKNTELYYCGKKTISKNFKYLDNIYLRRPYTSPEDLDIIISRYIPDYDIIAVNNICDFCLEEKKVLPISIRKLNLCKMATNY